VVAVPDFGAVSVVRVLVVDDQASFREAARALLCARGHVVVAEAGDSSAALEALGRVAPEAVLLDVRLGNESGLEVSRALISARPQLAVLLVSAEATTVSPEQLRESGARGFVPKRRLVSADLAALWGPD
jgi:two-component system chemotaxis response regulator CheY